MATPVRAHERKRDAATNTTYVEFGGEGTPVVLVHGLGGSTENWMAIGPQLARLGRVLALDLAGFGRTPRTTAATSSVHSNLAFLDRFLDEVVGEPAVLVGNSMGGAISIFQAAAKPEKVIGLVLVDPAVPRPPGSPVDPVVEMVFAAYLEPNAHELLADAAERFGPEGLVRNTMDLCCVDAGRVSTDIMDALIGLAVERTEMKWAATAQIEAACSLLELMEDPDAYYDEIRRIQAPTLLVHGRHDRLIPVEASEIIAGIRPDWTFKILEGIGHVPQLEAPDVLLGEVTGWLDRTGLISTR